MNRIERKSATLRRPAELVAHGLATAADLAGLEKVAARYAVAVTTDVAALIDLDDPGDPIARQFIPSAEELVAQPGENADPIGDHAHSPVAGIVHRYPDRVLLKLLHVCPVYCRFCFRREMVGPGAGTTMSEEDITAALTYIANDPHIWEVILTGGDPLILSPRRIRSLTEALASIPHVKILRWHTRVPVVSPGRITPELTAALASTTQTVYVAIHANHPRELTIGARLALRHLSEAGLTLVSQTVLLKGINDDTDTLEALMRAFVESRVKPYYLHHGDLAPGTAHLRTKVAHGLALMKALRIRLSGLGMPTYVLDVPGAHGKVPLGTDTAMEIASGRYSLTARDGSRHLYDDALPPTTATPTAR